MHTALPQLEYENLLPTRDYLRDVALVLGSLQRAFLPKWPHLWEHGLEVGMRGIMTQAMPVGDERIHASIDLVKHKVRLDGSRWLLQEYSAAEIFNNIRVWLETKNVAAQLEKPKLTGAGRYDQAQADTYAEALWWMDERFKAIKATFQSGIASPVLLYPHHFDLSLSWFPYEDDRQVSVGFSTGDDHISEPYVYVTTYPESAELASLELEPPLRFQAEGFRGIVLRYADLVHHESPENLIQQLPAVMESLSQTLIKIKPVS